MLGYDTLGLLCSKFKTDPFVNNVPQNRAFGLLASWPEPAWDHLRKCINSEKLTVGRFHAENAVACRNKNACKSEGKKGWDSKRLDSEIRKGTLDKSVAADVDTIRILSLGSPIKWYASPLLEHDQSEKAWKRLADIVLEVWPGIKLVNNPHSGWSGSYKGSVLERHGTGGFSAQVFSLDGKDLFDLNSSQLKQMRSSAKKKPYGDAWTFDMNGRSQGGARTCPEKRSGFPDGKRWKRIIERTEGG